MVIVSNDFSQQVNNTNLSSCYTSINCAVEIDLNCLIHRKKNTTDDYIFTDLYSYAEYKYNSVGIKRILFAREFYA